MKYRVKISNFTFGVPMGFLGYKYNPEQFEIIGIGDGRFGLDIGVGSYTTDERWEQIHAVLTTTHRGTLVFDDGNGKYSKPYARLLIKFK